MKTFLLLLVFFTATISMPSFSDVGPRGLSASMKSDGTVDTSTLEKHFINVINNEGASIPAGSLVILDVTADDGVSVIIDATASMTPLCIMVAACADNALCKCQTYGLYDTALFSPLNGNAVAGAPFFNSTAAAGYIGEVVLGGVEIPAGIFYDAATATGAVQVFIKLR